MPCSCSYLATDAWNVVATRGKDMKDEVARGLGLSMGYIANNPRELPFQMEGRLNARAGQNEVRG